MKNFTLIVAACGLLLTGAAVLYTGVTPAQAQAQDQPDPSEPETRYRVVFQVTSDTPKAWGGVLRNIDNMREALGKENVHIEVVGHSGGLPMLTRSNTETGDKVKALAADGVTFLACENTMARKDVSPDQLIEGVGTVDAGVAQVVRRQAQGWQYVRSGS